ncbi:MAG: endonuclease [Xenococcaceae cyanobacterium]
MQRDEFLDLAGGVYESNTYYSSWRGDDKYENFWAFFDDDSADYARSIYAGIDVDVLLRKKKHSIEHIIPKSFLKEYLKSANKPSTVVRGSTVNPLNFAACHRDINTKRSNFPFDIEGDRIIRSHTVHLEPIYSDYGLDRENEWIIPEKTRGDIARAVLYMCIIYEINELYGEHLNVYRNWAKIDPPNIWEIEFNKWVFQKHGIKNPLTTENPVDSISLLNDEELLNSILLLG